MKSQPIFIFVFFGLIWLALVLYLITHAPLTAYICFVIIASAIIIFVPLYKKYVKK